MMRKRSPNFNMNALSLQSAILVFTLNMSTAHGADAGAGVIDDPALSILSGTTGLLNARSVNAKIWMNHQFSQAFEQPLTWMQTVSSIAPLGKLLEAGIDDGSAVSSAVKALLGVQGSLASMHLTMMEAYEKETDKFTAYNGGVILDTHSISSANAKKAEQLVLNLTNPFPRLVNDGSSAMRAVTMQLVGTAIQKAQLSVPQHTLSTLRVNRQSQDGTTSYRSVLSSETQRRFFDKDNQWYSGLAVGSNSATLRELNHMAALQLALKYERFRQMENAELNLAANGLPDASSKEFLIAIAKALGISNAVINSISEKADERAKKEDAEAKEKEEEANKKQGKEKESKEPTEKEEDIKAPTVQ